MISVGVTSPSFSSNEVLRSELDCHFPNVKYNDTKRNLSVGEVKELLVDIDAAIVGLEVVNEELLIDCPKLKVISKYGVGLNNIDFNAVRTRGVDVYSSPGVNRRSVSELVMSFMLGISRNVFNSVWQLKNGCWNKNGGFELSGKTVGIIGYGNIGSDVARLLEPFGVNILVNDIVEVESKFTGKAIRQVSKEELCREADLITVHVPFDESTKYLLAKKEFDTMKSDVVVINTSRGGVIKEDDLLEKLNRSNISAALDVFEVEPQIGTKLVLNERVFPTPHIGGNSREAVLAMGRAAIYNLKKHYGIQ